MVAAVLLWAVRVYAAVALSQALGGPELEPRSRLRAAIVIIADGFSLRHARELGGATLLSFLDSASIGMANSRTADGGDRLLSAMATLGAGRRMGARQWAGYGLGSDETIGGERARDIYLRRMGQGADVSYGEILCLGYPELEMMAKESPYHGRPGLVGESLRLAGLNAAAIGNSDADEAMARPGVLLVMDASGRVSGGAVGEEVSNPDPGAPFGISCDVPQMAKAVADALTKLQAAVVAVDFGDMNRLARYSPNLSAEARTEQVGHCYARLDRLLGAIFDAVGPPSDDLAYILVSPGEPSILGPVAIAGWRYPAGMLTSDTTRREGLVTNLDFAPTILEGLGVRPAWPHDGSPMVALAARDGQDVAGHLIYMAESLQKAASSRVPVLSVFIGMVVIAVFAVLGVALLGPRAPGLLVGATRFLLLAVAAQPLLLLLAPVFRIQGIGAILFFTVVGSAMVSAALLRKAQSCMRSSVGIAFATGAAILTDALAGGVLAAASLLGHSAIVGARYYGIGNELMGALIGSVAISLAALGEAARRSGRAALYDRSKALAVAAVGMGVVSLLLGHPAVGANFGGMVTASVVASFMGGIAVARSGLGGRAKVGAVLAITLLAIVLCAGMAWNDAMGARSSHIGKAWRLLIRQNQEGKDGRGTIVSPAAGDSAGGMSSSGSGLGQLAVIAWRKLGMNMRLLRYTDWTRVLLAFLISLTVLAGKPFGLFRRFRDDYPMLHASLVGGLAGALAALIVNDSGVVACATVAMMPTFTLLSYVIDEIVAQRA
ncbi:MAG: hypothetical protein PHH46_00720 [Firmicutes bacterium]|nr:hypothetical protein [Bacillota bacterium]